MATYRERPICRQDHNRFQHFGSQQVEYIKLDAGQLDAAAVAELYAQYAAELRAFLTGVLRNSDLAAEALQSTFVKAAESGHAAQRDTIKGWLFRVAFNEAMLLRRKRDVDQRATRKVALQVAPESEPVDSGLLRSEVIERVRRGLDTLPADQRLVVRLRIYEDKTFAEISRELGIPIGTVVTRMRTALQKLNRELGQE